MRKVLYLSHATREVYAIIREAVPPGFELLTLERDSDEERRQKLADTPIVIVAATPFRRPLIEDAAKLELVHHQGVGWQDTTDHALLKSRGIPLAFTPEGTTIGVAEHTVCSSSPRSSGCRMRTRSSARAASTSMRCGRCRAS